MTPDAPSQRTPRLWGVAATILFHALVLLALVWICLTYTPGVEKERKWPPADEDEILYGGEYVMIGEDPNDATLNGEGLPDQSDALEQALEGLDNEDGGEALAEAPALIASAEPSPVKVKTAPEKKPGPTREELEKAEKERRERETAERVGKRVQFGSSSATADGSPKAGSKNGNSTTGALSGAPGTDLYGRSLASWAKPSGSATGTIIIQVTVNRKGVVTQARYIDGSGAIAADRAARRSCEQAAMKSTFSVSEAAPVAQVGRITYRFE